MTHNVKECKVEGAKKNGKINILVEHDCELRHMSK